MEKRKKLAQIPPFFQLADTKKVEYIFQALNFHFLPELNAKDFP